MNRLLMVCTLIFTLSTPALAEHFRGNAYGNSGYNNPVNLSYARQLLNEADNYIRNFRFRPAAYKLKTVRMELNRLTSSSSKRNAINAINTALTKLSDHYLGQYEKLELATDCIRVALNSLNSIGNDSGGNYTISKAKRKMNKAMRIVERGNYRRAAKILRRTRSLLRGLGYNSNVNQAINALKIMEDKICDSHLSHYEKVNFAKDCLRQAYLFLQQSNL